MKRTTIKGQGYVPDYKFTQQKFKNNLGIPDRNSVRQVGVEGSRITVDMSSVHLFRTRDHFVRYEYDQQEFKDRLGIADRRPILIVFASVWSNMVQMSHGVLHGADAGHGRGSDD